MLVNLPINIVHGTAHLKLHIDLNAAEKLFVAVVIPGGPLLAMALLWTLWQRLGFGLLALTMAGSLAFGLYHHFMSMGPDHVGAQVAGVWETTFVVTAWLAVFRGGRGYLRGRAVSLSGTVAYTLA